MPSARSQALRDAAVVFLACVSIYWLLRQHTSYGVDAWNDMRRLNGGDSRRLVHLLYMPIAAIAADWGRALGLTLHDSLQLLSNLGMAFGVACGHLALRGFGCPRRIALWASALMGTAPGLVFYATVVERHGPFFGCAGFAMLVAAWWSRRFPSAARAAIFGVSVGLAYAAHSTGVLLLALLIPLAWVVSADAAGVGRRLVVSAVAVVAAALCVEVGNQIGIDVDPAAVGMPERRDLASLKIYAEHAVERPERFPIVLWREMLWPLLPIAWLWVVGFSRVEERRLARATLIGLSVYVILAFLILAGFSEQGGMNEHGAYLLPLSLPLAWICARCWSDRGLVLALVLSVITAIWHVRDHDRRPQAAIAAAVRAEIGEDVMPFWLLGSREDFEMLVLEYPDHRPPDPGVMRDYFDMYASALVMEDVARAEEVAPLLPQFLTTFLDKDRPILMTETGRAFLRSPRRATFPHIGPLYLESLERAFEFVPIGDGRVFRLVPRGG